MTKLRHILVLNIKEKRRSLGFSQAKLAEIAGTAPTYIAMLELEKRSPSLEMVEQIAEALGIEPSELFSGACLPASVIKKFHESVLAEFEEVLKSKITEFEKEFYNAAPMKKPPVSMVAEKIELYD